MTETGSNKKTLERNLSEQEFRDLIAYAASLQRFDETINESGLSLSVFGSPSSDGWISLPEIYQVAGELAIPQGYIDKALRIRHPSIDDILGDIERHGATPTITNIGTTYRDVLLSDLLSLHTTDGFKVGDEISETWARLQFQRVIEKEERTRFRKKLKKTQSFEPLAKFNFLGYKHDNTPKGKFSLGILLQDPLFLMVCGENLERLNDKFGDLMHNYEISHDY